MAGCGYHFPVEAVKESKLDMTQPTQREVVEAIAKADPLGAMSGWSGDFEKNFEQRADEIGAQIRTLLRRIIIERKKFYKIGKKGEELDFKRTITRSLENGGTPIDLYWREKHLIRKNPPHVYFLIDHTGSMTLQMDLALLMTMEFSYVAGNIPVSFWVYGTEDGMDVKRFYAAAVEAERKNADFDPSSYQEFRRISNKTIRQNLSTKGRAKYSKEIMNHSFGNFEFPSTLTYLISEVNMGREFIIIVLHDSEQVLYFPSEVPIRNNIINNLKGRVFFVNFNGWKNEGMHRAGHNDALKFGFQHAVLNIGAEHYMQDNETYTKASQMHSPSVLYPDKNFIPDKAVQINKNGSVNTSVLAQVIVQLVTIMGDFAAKTKR